MTQDNWRHNLKTLDYWANEFESLARRDAPVKNPRIRWLQLRAQSLMRRMKNDVNASEHHEIDPAMAEQYNSYFRELIRIVEKLDRARIAREHGKKDGFKYGRASPKPTNRQLNIDYTHHLAATAGNPAAARANLVKELVIKTGCAATPVRGWLRAGLKK